MQETSRMVNVGVIILNEDDDDDDDDEDFREKKSLAKCMPCNSLYFLIYLGKHTVTVGSWCVVLPSKQRS